jgi:hypothetical protein
MYLTQISIDPANIDVAIAVMRQRFIESGEDPEDDAFLEQQIHYWTHHHQRQLEFCPGRGQGLNLLWEFDKVHHIQPADVFPKALCIGEIKVMHDIFHAVEHAPRKNIQAVVKAAVERLKMI